jgi:hypothetical protein
MSPQVQKALMTGAGGVLVALGASPPVPWLVPFGPLLTALGGVLGGGALLPQPGALKAAREAARLLAIEVEAHETTREAFRRVVEGEK